MQSNNSSTLAEFLKSDDLHKKSNRYDLERSEELYHLLNHLSEEERALIIATELEGYTFKELAEVWRVPINTLLSKKSRAMKKLMRLASISNGDQ